jgi:purine nucleosidase
MSIDVDDVGAVCAMHALADLGEVHILAVVHNSHSTEGVGALSVLNRYYGHDDVPLGAYRGPVGMPTDNCQSPWGFWREPPMPPWQVGPYVGDMVANFPSLIRNASQAYDATALLRIVLSAAQPTSVTYVSVGYATNLLNLLESGPDEISHLTGQELVSQKVKELVIMAGRHDHTIDPGGSAEWNVAGATWINSVCGDGGCGAHGNLGNITNRTLALWPRQTRLVFLDFETGVDVMTGDVLREGAPESSPCRHAYGVFCWINQGWCNRMDRCSWDIMALIYAVRGTEKLYTLEPGHNEVDPRTAYNRWTPAHNPTNSTLDTWTEFSLVLPPEMRAAVAQEISDLLLREPVAGQRTPPPRPPPRPPRRF